ncbi:hypothetical protein SRHO_G00259570 [Serrasalmus rhombeus]
MDYFAYQLKRIQKDPPVEKRHELQMSSLKMQSTLSKRTALVRGGACDVTLRRRIPIGHTTSGGGAEM